MPGSIIDNTQNLEFATFVAGQIARTAAIFNVDEVGLLISQLHHRNCIVNMAACYAWHSPAESVDDDWTWSRLAPVGAEADPAAGGGN